MDLHNDFFSKDTVSYSDPRLSWNSQNPPASASQVLVLQVWATIPKLMKNLLITIHPSVTHTEANTFLFVLLLFLFILKVSLLCRPNPRLLAKVCWQLRWTLSLFRVLPHVATDKASSDRWKEKAPTALRAP